MIIKQSVLIKCYILKEIKKIKHLQDNQQKGPETQKNIAIFTKEPKMSEYMVATYNLKYKQCLQSHGTE